MAFPPRASQRRDAAYRPARLRSARSLLFALLAAIVVTTDPAGVAPLAQVLEAGEAQAYVAVLRRDRPVMGLGPGDFRVEEDGDRREVLRVEPATAAFNVALLVDDSMVASNNIVHVREALVSFVEAMSGHRISLIAFGDQRQTVVDYTADTALLRQAAQRFSGFSETSAYLVAAVDETAVELAARRAMRPAIVLLTTEGRGMQDLAIQGIGLPARGRSTPDASRDQDAEAVAERLWGYGVVMHAVALTSLRSVGFSDFGRSNGLATITSGAGAFRWMQENRERERMLDKGPSDSGGRLYKVSSTSGIAERLRRIATELNTQYLVTYHRPALDEPPEELRVRVNRRRLTVRATPARYYLPPATGVRGRRGRGGGRDGLSPFSRLPGAGARPDRTDRCGAAGRARLDREDVPVLPRRADAPGRRRRGWALSRRGSCGPAPGGPCRKACIDDKRGVER